LYCNNQLQLGSESGGIHQCTNRYLENLIRRHKRYPDNPNDVSFSKAPQASSAGRRLKQLYPHHFPVNVAHVNMLDSSKHSSPLSVQDDSFESYDPFLRANRQKTCRSSSKDVNANNADVAAHVSCLSPLTISSSGKNKGTKPCAPACASQDPQSLYTLYNGIPPNMNHALYYKLAMGLNSVVVLNHKNPHTLPPNIFFFRVDGSTIPNKKISM
jgi:hypothetical protein